MKRYYIISVFGILIFLTSCFKEDEKIQPHDPGDVTTVQIGMTSTYEHQVYYDLASGQEMGDNIKTEWDLGFEASDSGWHIILNSAKFMLAANTGLTDFNAVVDTVGQVFDFDNSDGNLDSTAIGNWIVFDEPNFIAYFPQNVYIINRGYDEVGNFQGFQKVVFQSLVDDEYTLRFANLDGTNEFISTVVKDSSVSFVSFTFDSGGSQMILEPDKRQWTLQFTQYTSLVYTNLGEPYPYLVTGTLSNRFHVGVAKDTVMHFEEITLDDALGLDYNQSLDAIGYDWKVAVGDPTSGEITYVTRTDLSYIIRDYHGFHYKLRFVSFYNDAGDKGYPKFEYQRL